MCSHIYIYIYIYVGVGTWGGGGGRRREGREEGEGGREGRREKEGGKGGIEACAPPPPKYFDSPTQNTINIHKPDTYVDVVAHAHPPQTKICPYTYLHYCRIHSYHSGCDPQAHHHECVHRMSH